MHLVFFFIFALLGCPLTSISSPDTFYALKRASELELEIDRSVDLVGVGILHTENVFGPEVLRYYASKNQRDDRANIKSFTLTSSQATCRLYGYLDHCNHPFVQLGGSLFGNDLTPPFEADFYVTAEYVEGANKPSDVKHFPFFVAGVIPIFNLPGIPTLILGRDVVAKIFRGCDMNKTLNCLPGSITMWNDPMIKATNPPSVHPVLDQAGKIKLITRTDTTWTTLTIKRFCSRYDPEFKLQIPIDDSSNWTGVDVTELYSPEAVMEYIVQNPGTIGYTPVHVAHDRPSLGKVILTDYVHEVEATSHSITVAYQDIGLVYGNDGRNPSEHTVDLSGSPAQNAWPITKLIYLAVRTETLGNGTQDCLKKAKDLLDFLEFFYSSNDTTLMFSQGVSRLNSIDSASILDMVRSSIKCNGTVVYQFPEPPAEIVVYASDTLNGLLQTIIDGFQTSVTSDVLIEVVNRVPHSQVFSEELDPSFSKGIIAIGDENFSAEILTDAKVNNNVSLTILPIAGIANGFIYNFCPPGNLSCPNIQNLQISIRVAAWILDGTITMWNDSRIQQLNPFVTLPAVTIIPVFGPRNLDFYFNFIDFVRRDYVPDFALQADGLRRLTFDEVYQSVSVIPYTFAYVPFNGTKYDRIQFAMIENRFGKGQYVSHSTANIQACGYDTFDSISGVFNLASSLQQSCYPIVDAVNVITKRQYATMTAHQRKSAIATAQLVEFIINRSYKPNNSDTTIYSSTGIGTFTGIDTVDNINLQNLLALKLQNLMVDEIPVLIIPQEMNWIPYSLIVLAYVILGLELACFASLGVWVGIHRNRKLVRNSSPTFMIQILLGAAMMALTVIPLAQQDDFRVPQAVYPEDLNVATPQLDMACTSQPILFSIGYFLIFSALFLKSWRLIRIFNNKKLRNLYLRDRELLVYQLCVMSVVAALNLIWALRNPLLWTREAVFFNINGMIIESQGICFAKKGIYDALPLIIAIMIFLVLGNYLAYLGRRIPTEFNESKWTALAMVVTLEAFAMSVPILIMANDNPVSGFVVKASVCLLVAGVNVGLVFFPKVALAYGIGLQPGESNPWRFVKGDSSGSGKEGDKNNHGPKDSVKNDSRKIYQDQEFASGKILSSAGSFSHLPVVHSKQTSKRLSKDLERPASSQTLKAILDDDPIRRRFRRYLQTLKMDENLRFWDCVLVTKSEKNPSKRAVSGRAIIQTFILDSAPYQVNLSSKTKEKIIKVFMDNDMDALAAEDFFDEASNELFLDLRQSDAFRIFLENDTFSASDLTSNKTSKSDPTILVTEIKGNIV